MRWLSDNDKKSRKTAKPKASGRGASGSKGRAGSKLRSRRANPKWRRLARQGVWGGIGLCVAGFFGWTVWLWESGWFADQTQRLTDRSLRWSAEVGLEVDDVLVAGRNRTEQASILRALGVDRGLPLLSFNPHDAKQRLESLPWIASAEVERRLPDLVYVRIVERLPMAIWQLDQSYSVLDRDGVVIPGAKVEDFAGLPLVVGAGAAPHASDLLALLDSEPSLQRHVIAATRIGERRWNVHLNDGIDVQLPEQDGAAAWSQLARLDRQHGLLARDITLIDLRQPDRLIVRTRPSPGDETDT